MRIIIGWHQKVKGFIILIEIGWLMLYWMKEHFRYNVDEILHIGLQYKW